MKILMSALACEPGKGSELEVGYRALLAAASRHEVWVITNQASVPILRRALDAYPFADRVHLEGIYFEVDDELYRQLTAPGFQWHYDRWQRRAAVRAAELDARIDFDIVHHATVAAHWTRAGVTSVHKPLVLGPVGGGVEAPLPLVRELGMRGIVEDIGRVVARRLLTRFGPARAAQQRAVVVFAQNEETARAISTRGRLQILPNATCVDVREVAVTGPRKRDILLVGRLLPWKGGPLAVRSLQYLRHRDAVLRIFGDGPDRDRIARAARRWGVADRVRFESRVSREELLEAVATAGVFLHPSLHDESPLALAEALSLGAPVVCLERGGPAELLRHWPDAPATAVRPQSPAATARALAAAIDRFLSDPPPLLSTPRRPITSFEQGLLDAYDVAFDAGRERARPGATVWGFPAGKPQFFADTLETLSKGVLVYGFGRRIPRAVQRGIAWQVRLPGVRRLVAERCPQVEPVCGWGVWATIAETIRERQPHTSGQWLHLRSQWGKQRSNIVTLDGTGRPESFTVVEPVGRYWNGSLKPVPSFRVPACTDAFLVGDWSVRQYEPLPQFHRPAPWDPERIRHVAADVALALRDTLERPAGIPAHWQPMHGDLVPWNLREDDAGQLWLLDWEDAGWAPPLADLVRFIVAYYSLGWSRPERIAARVRTLLAEESGAAVLEVARFWLQHHNLRPVQHAHTWRRTKAKDAARAAREFAAFQVLTSRTDLTPARAAAI